MNSTTSHIQMCIILGTSHKNEKRLRRGQHISFFRLHSIGIKTIWFRWICFSCNAFVRNTIVILNWYIYTFIYGLSSNFVLFSPSIHFISLRFCYSYRIILTWLSRSNIVHPGNIYGELWVRNAWNSIF